MPCALTKIIGVVLFGGSFAVPHNILPLEGLMPRLFPGSTASETAVQSEMAVQQTPKQQAPLQQTPNQEDLELMSLGKLVSLETQALRALSVTKEHYIAAAEEEARLLKARFNVTKWNTMTAQAADTVTAAWQRAKESAQHDMKRDPTSEKNASGQQASAHVERAVADAVKNLDAVTAKIVLVKAELVNISGKVDRSSERKARIAKSLAEARHKAATISAAIRKVQKAQADKQHKVEADISGLRHQEADLGVFGQSKAPAASPVASPAASDQSSADFKRAAEALHEAARQRRDSNHTQA